MAPYHSTCALAFVTMQKEGLTLQKDTVDLSLVAIDMHPAPTLSIYYYNSHPKESGLPFMLNLIIEWM